MNTPSLLTSIRRATLTVALAAFAVAVTYAQSLATGIVEAVKEVGLTLPLVVRLEGNNVLAGKATLDASGLALVSGSTMADAAQKIVKLVA